MNKQTLIFLMIAFVTLNCACESGGGGGGGTTSASPAVTLQPVIPSPTPTPTPSPTPSPTPDPSQGSTVSLTYYSLARTGTTSGKTYTVTGSCATYIAKTYCWDDGVKTIAMFKDWQNNWYGPYSYTYWGLQNSSGSTGYGTCSGSCASSYMTTPRDMSLNSLPANVPSSDINDVFSHGVQNQVNCTEASGVLTCGSLVITL